MSVFTDIEHCVGSFSQALRLEKEIKRIPIGREEVKLSLFEDDMIQKILKNPQNSYLTPVSEYSTVVCFRISTQKSVVFPYTVCLVTQSCLTLCNPMDCSLPSSSVHGSFPCKNIGEVAMPSCRGSLQPRDKPRSPHFRQILYYLCHQGSPYQVLSIQKVFR